MLDTASSSSKEKHKKCTGNQNWQNNHVALRGQDERLRRVRLIVETFSEAPLARDRKIEHCITPNGLENDNDWDYFRHLHIKLSIFHGTVTTQVFAKYLSVVKLTYAALGLAQNCHVKWTRMKSLRKVKNGEFGECYRMQLDEVYEWRVHSENKSMTAEVFLR